MTAEAYPLKWPDGWPRTPAAKRAAGNQFHQVRTVYTGTGSYRQRGAITPGVAYKGLVEELKRLGAKNVTISSNVPTRQDGAMRADAADRRHADPGIAAYFTLKGRATVMAQDAYVGIAENMRSLTLAVDAMRALERHGGGTMMNKAFDGFSALPPPEGYKKRRPWWEVLGYPENADERPYLSVAEVEARFRAMAKKFHPDAGGDAAEMAELNGARDDAIEELGKAEEE